MRQISSLPMLLLGHATAQPCVLHSLVMSFGFINLLMLAGLAGVALPVVVHLISRRKYDVVDWGAMQFLELGRRTRRRIRLEELLLLLLRMVLVALLALALARPWAKGAWFSNWARATPRDVAVVIDGSYSMGWEGDTVTPHAAAIQLTHELLEELGSSDTVTLLDARDSVRSLTDRPTSDFRVVREELDTLPSPAGTSSAVAALNKAAQLLTTGEHLDRDIILLTDAQRQSWKPDEERAWRRLDESVKQSTISPRVWAVDVAGYEPDAVVNFSVDRLQLSRELSVPGFPMRFEATVRQWGGTSIQRDVHFAINGRRLSGKTVTVSLPPNGEANVVFEHRFESVGSYVATISLDHDNLPGDNQSDAAIIVEKSIPVLLVDGNLHRDRTQSETFFLQAALSPSTSDAPWVQATVIDANEFTESTLTGQRVVFLANVSRVSDAQFEALQTFVADGGGLVIAPGDRIDAQSYNRWLNDDGQGLLAAIFETIKHERDYDLGDVNISSESLNTSWIARFRRENAVDLTEARFAHWWRVTTPTGPKEERSEPSPSETPSTQAEIVAKLDTGDPLLVTRSFGDGTVVQLAAPLDSDWSTLPAKNDFVPFLHEIVFHLASRSSGRNVTPGQPLILDDASGSPSEQTVEFKTPDGQVVAADEFGLGDESRLGLEDTILPGVYRAQIVEEESTRTEYFVVHSERDESDLTQLSPPEQERIAGEDRVRFVTSLDEIVAGMAEDEVPSELWRWLLLGVLLLLVSEVLMTRRLVRGGHEVIEELPVDDGRTS